MVAMWGRSLNAGRAVVERDELVDGCIVAGRVGAVARPRENTGLAREIYSMPRPGVYPSSRSLAGPTDETTPPAT